MEKINLVVDYDRSVEDGVKAGKYNGLNRDITSSHFPSNESGTKEVSVELVDFEQDMKTAWVIAKLDKAGMRPATLKELLALGEKCPEIRNGYEIIILGSIWQKSDGYPNCVSLHRDGRSIELRTDWIGGWWDKGNVFAAVRK